MRNRDLMEKSSRSRFSSLLATGDRDYLLSPSGAQLKVSDLEGQVVGLYFSANWYQLCQNFDRVLTDTYQQLKSAGADFEVVLVSADEDSNAFDNYRSSMPWPAIAFSDLELKKALNQRFNVDGIPCLVIMQPYDDDEDEELCNGVELVYRFGARAFPFTKGRLEELEMEDRERQENQNLRELLTNQSRDFLLGHPRTRQVPVSSLVGKTAGLFFSAQWCLPGMKFTPKLISIYQKIKVMLKETTDVGDFEIVYVPSDRDQASFDSYHDLMPWPALPFGDPKVRALTKHFEVQAIPCLIILGPHGKTVTRDGRTLINLYEENAYPFTNARLEVLQKQSDDEAKNLPRSRFHSGHRHELNLVSEGNGGGPFICCDCDEQGSGWAYQCLLCGYEVHPKCVRN